MMVECPQCEYEINFLNVYETAQSKHDISINENNQVNHGVSTPLDWVDSTDYECPRCNQTLFDNEEDAVKFLRG